MRKAAPVALALLAAACSPSPAVVQRAAERAEMQRHAEENMRWCLEGIAENCRAAGRAMVASRGKGRI